MPVYTVVAKFDCRLVNRRKSIHSFTQRQFRTQFRRHVEGTVQRKREKNLFLFKTSTNEKSKETLVVYNSSLNLPATISLFLVIISAKLANGTEFKMSNTVTALLNSLKIHYTRDPAVSVFSPLKSQKSPNKGWIKRDK
jgi:hypothetical protein